MARDVAVVGFAQLPGNRAYEDREEVELVQPVVQELLKGAGITKDQVDFTVSGSADYLIGRPFSFVSALDAVAPWPPISESHVEMDGAWALYEAWVRLLHGDMDVALVYAYGKSSLGDLRDILTMQLDPYNVAPLNPDSVSLAALQARMLLDQGKCTERQMAEVAARDRASAKDNPNAQLSGDFDPDELLSDPYLVEPLRRHDCPPITDGACAVLLAAGDRARELSDRPAFIRGIDHRVEAHSLGLRELTDSVSTRIAAKAAGLGDGPVDLAELHAPFSHQAIILEQALGLGQGVSINPSGGALSTNAMMVAGLTRIGEAATRVSRGDANRALAHATSGPCLQQNLVCILEAS